MLKKFGYSLIAVSALTFSAGVVNSSFISSVLAEDKEKDKEGKSDELMTGSVKTAFADSIMSEDKSKEKDKEGKSGELI